MNPADHTTPPPPDPAASPPDHTTPPSDEWTTPLDLRDPVNRWLDERRDDAIDLLRRLVRARSTQGHERAAQQIVAEHLRILGLEVDVWDPDGPTLSNDPYFCSPRTDFGGSPNVVGVWKGSGGGRSMILNGHIDVVPVGDPSQWTRDPWAADVDEGRLYGRGASDMKGGSVSLLLGVAALRSLGVRLKGDVIVQSVVDEESGGAGTLAAIRRGYRADAALVPEPTGMRIFPKQQGSLWFRLTVAGRGAHGGTRYEGVSAIEKTLPVLAALAHLETERNARIDDPLYAGSPIPVPVNVGSIKGGDWPSMVPDRVTLEGRLGVIPGEPVEAAQAEMAAALGAIADDDCWFAEHPVTLEWFGARWLPGDVDEGSDLVRSLSARYRDVLGEDPVIAASPWGTDAGLLAAVGDTPGVVFGPGTTAVAHYADEYVEIDRVLEVAAIVALTLVDWCGVAR
ncbi:MAG: peptidase [Actinobacteria bacterium]|nr:peptidase [Actinomycetota bacterium]